MCAVVFRPDGRWLATASFDRTIKVWDATTGELLHTLRGHTGVITGLAFSRDGRRLFSSGGEDKTVKVWDPQTEREVLNLRGHTLFCHGLASSPDGLRLASAGKDGTIRIWDATPVKEDEGLESITCKHDYEVWSVEFSPDGGYLASAGAYPTSSSLGNLTVRIWDARTGDSTTRPASSAERLDRLSRGVQPRRQAPRRGRCKPRGRSDRQRLGDGDRSRGHR